MYEQANQSLISAWAPEPDLKSKTVVTDPRFYNLQSGQFKQFRQNKRQWKNDYSDWLGSYKSSTPEYEANADKDKAVLNWGYDFINKGGLENQNAGLRATARAARAEQEKNAQDFASNSAEFARVAGGGNPSSADYARRLASGRRIAGDFALQDVNQERLDRDSELKYKLGSAGAGRQINAIIDQLLSRKLQPSQLSDAHLAATSQLLNTIGSGTPFGSEHAIWKDPSDLEKGLSTASAVASIYGSAYGGGGGGAGGGAGGGGGGMY